LSVSGGNVVTITVEHRRESPAGGSFVYPIIAGTGWEGGYRTISVELAEPPPPGEGEEPGEEGSVSEEGGSIAIMAYSAPISLSAPSGAVHERRFKFTYCWPKHIPGNPFPPGKFDPTFGPEGHARTEISGEASECHREDFHGVHWATTVHGHYEYETGSWVNVHADLLQCRQWGEERPKKKNCKLIPQGRTSKADVVGEYRFHAGMGDWAWEAKPTCFIWGGEISPTASPGRGEPYERPAVWEPVALTYALESCDWPRYERKALG
jgi:hypothetical protein